MMDEEVEQYERWRVEGHGRLPRMQETEVLQKGMHGKQGKDAEYYFCGF